MITIPIPTNFYCYTKPPKMMIPTKHGHKYDAGHTLLGSNLSAFMRNKIITGKDNQSRGFARICGMKIDSRGKALSERNMKH